MESVHLLSSNQRGHEKPRCRGWLAVLCIATADFRMTIDYRSRAMALSTCDDAYWRTCNTWAHYFTFNQDEMGVIGTNGVSWQLVSGTNVRAYYTEASMQLWHRSGKFHNFIQSRAINFSMQPDIAARAEEHIIGGVGKEAGAQRLRVAKSIAEQQVNDGPELRDVLSRRKGWQAGPNAFFDSMTFGDVALLLQRPEHNGTARQSRGHSPRAPSDQQVAIPGAFDARAEWPECRTIGAIRSQGSCGACWAFGASEALADRLCIASGGRSFAGPNDTLSPQWMVSCHRGRQSGCSSGLVDVAWSNLRASGVATEACAPYTASDSTCPANCTDGSVPVLYRVSDAYLCFVERDWGRTAVAVQEEIAARGPVEAAMVVFSDFVYYKSPVYQLTQGSMLVGNHTVKIIGWGQSDDGTPFCKPAAMSCGIPQSAGDPAAPYEAEQVRVLVRSRTGGQKGPQMLVWTGTMFDLSSWSGNLQATLATIANRVADACKASPVS
eukprot:m51a1_g11573 putative cathepsin b precursor (495) ;mRNA; f:18359-21458